MGNNMALGLVLLMAIVAGMAWYWKSHPNLTLHKHGHPNSAKTRGTGGSTKGATTAKIGIKESVQKFHAVSIQHTDDACAAVKEIADQRFLAKTAPAIPLPNCDAASCHCGYVHYSDRRDEDRRSLYSVQTELYKQSTGQDRRDERGRRKGDSSR
jgi:hypothetical protein